MISPSGEVQWCNIRWTSDYCSVCLIHHASTCLLW